MHQNRIVLWSLTYIYENVLELIQFLTYFVHAQGL